MDKFLWMIGTILGKLVIVITALGSLMMSAFVIGFICKFIKLAFNIGYSLI